MGKSPTVFRQLRPLTSNREISRLKGEFASSMYPDAASVYDNLECLQEEEWMGIDMTDEDGEVAAYLQLVSNNMVESKSSINLNIHRNPLILRLTSTSTPRPRVLVVKILDGKAKKLASRVT